jgi:hypothetical protein
MRVGIEGDSKVGCGAQLENNMLVAMNRTKKMKGAFPVFFNSIS